MRPGLLRQVLETVAGIAVGVAIDAARVRRYSTSLDPHRFPHPVDDAELDARIGRLIERMSVDEKLEQLSGDTDLPRFVWQWSVRLLLRRGAPHVYAGRNERLGLPPLCFADGPRGVAVGRGATSFPVTIARGASWDRELEGRIGEAMAREARAVGANYSAAVCVNVLRHPGWGRAQETYGEDPFHLGELGVALTRGLQRHNVMACVKHLAVNSIERSRFYVDVRAAERTLREVYLPAFEAVVRRGGAASVMSAYNKLRGEYCGHSRWLLTEVLRDDWGFEGFVSSDWVHGVRDGEAALRAGMDLEMPARRHYGAGLRRAIESGRVPTELLDDSVRRVLRTRLRFASAPDPERYGPSVLASPEHVALAREAAEASAVLVRNDGILPLTPSVRRVALVGRLASLPLTGDRGSSHVHSPWVCTAEHGVAEAAGARGVELLRPRDHSVASAVEVAGQADVAVLVVGLSHRDEGEYLVLDPEAGAQARQAPLFGGPGDRVDLALPPATVALIAAVTEANPRTVVVVSGSAVAPWGWLPRPAAVLMTFYAGMEGGRALARLLWGEVSPSGKLPFTIPADPADLPPFDPAADTVEYGPFHGYTKLDHEQRPALLPFGHGLSYTRFGYDQLRVHRATLGPHDTLEVQVRVTNEGARRGAEVVQLYVGFPPGDPERPRRLLRGFDKIMLEPGASQRVRLSVPVARLACWDEAARDWRVPPGPHRVLVGGSSDPAALLAAPFEIT